MTGNTIFYNGITFPDVDVRRGNTTGSRAPIADVLTIDTFEFDVRYDDASLIRFVRNTPLTFYHNDEKIGIYYVQSISRTSLNTYHFSCTSLVGLLDEAYHNGGIYTGQTVQEVIADICGAFAVYVKTNLRRIQLYGWLPIATVRENLSQVLFAIGATLKVDYDGAMRIEGLWDGQSSQITASELYAGGSVEYATPVTEVVVTEHSYLKSATETTELFEGTTAEGDKITFDEPCYDLSASGFGIIESGANYAIVTAGSGTLSGKKYVHVRRQVSKILGVNTQSLTAQSDNAFKVEDATLVSMLNSIAVADRLADYYAHTERINHKVVRKRETPGDVVKIAHPYGGEVQGYIESADIILSGILAAEESILVGYTPPEIGEVEYYDTVLALTEGTAWTVPENVTTARVVLIGGGQGGGKGQDGAAGKNDGAEVVNTEYRYYKAKLFGTGGDGGVAGTGGTRGKVLQTTISLTPGAIIPYTIGRGGAGGTTGSESGGMGTNTTFGDLTSASGSIPEEEGYVDIVTGKRYAVDGVDGVAGGKGTGGNGVDAHPPASVDEYTVTDLDGVVWYPGETRDESANKTWDSAQVSIFAYSGLGGGAAVGANGEDGASAATDASGDPVGGKSGNGANAIAPKIQTVRGGGGNGGHGGGGGGGMSAYSLNSHYGHEASPGAVGQGGLGSDGGAGGDGCILIYYRTYRQSSSGRFIARDGMHFDEKHGRAVVC